MTAFAQYSTTLDPILSSNIKDATAITSTASCCPKLWARLGIHMTGGKRRAGGGGWDYLPNKVVSVGGVDLGLVGKVLGVGKVPQGTCQLLLDLR